MEGKLAYSRLCSLTLSLSLPAALVTFPTTTRPLHTSKPFFYVLLPRPKMPLLGVYLEPFSVVSQNKLKFCLCLSWTQSPHSPGSHDPCICITVVSYVSDCRSWIPHKKPLDGGNSLFWLTTSPALLPHFAFSPGHQPMIPAAYKVLSRNDFSVLESLNTIENRG